MGGFDFVCHKEDIEAICLAISTLHYRGIAIQPTVRRSILFLKQQYIITGQREYLHTSLLIIQAFLKVGHVYEDEQELFDEVLALLGMSKSDVFPKRFYSSCRIILSRPQVRNMIRRWRPSRENPMKINDVVDDIIDKVRNKEIGHYFYEYKGGWNGKGESAQTDLYELVVAEDECFFCDIRNHKYYTFYETKK